MTPITSYRISSFIETAIQSPADHAGPLLSPPPRNRRPAPVHRLGCIDQARPALPEHTTKIVTDTGAQRSEQGLLPPTRSRIRRRWDVLDKKIGHLKALDAWDLGQERDQTVHVRTPAHCDDGRDFDVVANDVLLDAHGLDIDIHPFQMALELVSQTLAILDTDDDRFRCRAANVSQTD